MVVHIAQSSDGLNYVPMDFEAKVTIEMKSPHGYLSAADWPLLSVRYLMLAAIMSCIRFSIFYLGNRN